MPWIQLVSDEPDLAAVVGRFAPEGTIVRIAGGRGAGLPTPPAAIVVATAGSRTQFIQRTLEELDSRGMKARTVVLAPFSRELATVLVRLTCPHVVWLDDAGRELGSILRRMVESDLRFVVSQTLLDNCGEDALLRRAVRQAFVGTDCPTNVSDLAGRAHCTPSTLRAHWRKSALPGSPQALVEWAVLAALAEMRGEGSKISAVSRILGLHETTLYRASRRRIGISPSQVDRTALLAAVDDWLMEEAG